jgi:hypothetical protein
MHCLMEGNYFPRIMFRDRTFPSLSGLLSSLGFGVRRNGTKILALTLTQCSTWSKFLQGLCSLTHKMECHTKLLTVVLWTRELWELLANCKMLLKPESLMLMHSGKNKTKQKKNRFFLSQGPSGRLACSGVRGSHSFHAIQHTHTHTHTCLCHW